MSIILEQSIFNPGPANAYLDSNIIVDLDSNITSGTLTIDLSTVNDDTVQLYLLPGYNRIGITIQVDEDDKLTIIPLVPFEPNAEYQLIIVSGVTGLKTTTNEKLDSNLIIPFKTGDMLTPESQNGEDPVEDNDWDLTHEHIDDSVRIVVPDVTPQGTLIGYKECTPTFSSVIEPGYSGEPITNQLDMISSIPYNYENGVLSIDEIITIWKTDIHIANNNPSKLTYQVLGINTDPFAVNIIDYSGLPMAIDNQMIQSYNYTETLVNKEFIYTVKTGAVENLDGSQKNIKTIVQFTGPLQPMLCTIEMAQTKAGLWDYEFSLKDRYYFNKLIYIESTLAIIDQGRTDIDSLTDDELVKLSRYVCCLIALYMLSKMSGGINSAGLYVSERRLPGTVFKYSEMSGKIDETSPSGKILDELLECVEKNRPKHNRAVKEGNWGIGTGLKSKEMISFPSRRRL